MLHAASRQTTARASPLPPRASCIFGQGPRVAPSATTRPCSRAPPSRRSPGSGVAVAGTGMNLRRVKMAADGDSAADKRVALSSRVIAVFNAAMSACHNVRRTRQTEDTSYAQLRRARQGATYPSRTERHGCGEDLDDGEPESRRAGRVLLWLSALWANISHEFKERTVDSEDAESCVEDPAARRDILRHAGPLARSCFLRGWELDGDCGMPWLASKRSGSG